MTSQVSIAPRSSLILIMDKETGDVPSSMGNTLLAHTESCIAVGTLAEMDGETTIILTDERNCAAADPTMHRVFAGVLTTPRKEIHVCTVEMECLLRQSVVSARTLLEVWVNHKTEPSRIAVLLDV